MDARGVLVKCAEELPKEAWKVRVRKPKYTVKTQERQKPEKRKSSKKRDIRTYGWRVNE